MNVIREIFHQFVSYPFSLIRRTLSFVWTRGLASSLLPFTRRQPIKPPDSSTSKGSTESTQETVIVMSSAPSSTEAKDVSVDLMKGNNENENKHSSSDSDHLEIPAHIHVPAKRNSSTLDKETLEKVVVCPKEDLGNQFSFPQVQFEDYIDPIVKKPKLEVLPPAVLLLDGSGDGLHNKQYGKVSVKVNKEKRKHSKKHNKHYKGTGNGSSEETDESMPMNHFIAIQMSNPELLAKLNEIQNEMLETQLQLSHAAYKKINDGSIFSSCMISSRKMHLTLYVCHLKDDQLEIAKRGLKKIWENHRSYFESQAMNLKLEGLGHFKNNVLFAKIQGGDHISKLEEIAQELQDEFHNLEIHGDDEKSFKPHITVAKLSKANRRDKILKHIRSFPRELWINHEATFLGHQLVESLQLLKMKGDPKTGYYEIVEEFPLIMKEVKADEDLKLDEKKVGE